MGRGARFHVELPLVQGPRERAPASPRIIEEGPIARVLLVEDNADTRSLITDALILSGYEVLPAASGEEALDLLREEPRPDVILSDIGLPGIDGCELLTRVRALPGLSEVPAFAVTGYGQEQDVERGRRAGFVGHFVKPVDMAALDQRLRAWLGVR